LLGEDLGPLSVKELQSLEKQLEGALQLARQRKVPTYQLSLVDFPTQHEEDFLLVLCNCPPV